MSVRSSQVRTSPEWLLALGMITHIVKPLIMDLIVNHLQWWAIIHRSTLLTLRWLVWNCSLLGTPGSQSGLIRSIVLIFALNTYRTLQSNLVQNCIKLHILYRSNLTFFYSIHWSENMKNIFCFSSNLISLEFLTSSSIVYILFECKRKMFILKNHIKKQNPLYSWWGEIAFFSVGNENGVGSFSLVKSPVHFLARLL